MIADRKRKREIEDIENVTSATKRQRLPRYFSSVQDKRIALFNVLTANNESIRACDINRIITDSKILSTEEKSSASETVIVLGKFPVELYKYPDFHGNTEIAVKMSFESLNPKIDNSLEIERRAYKEVTNPLLINGNTPHVMLYAGAFNCTHFLSIIKSGKLNVTLVTEIEKIYKRGRYDIDNMWLLVLEKGKGLPLNAFIKKNSNRLNWDNFYYPIIFQVVFTLLCFQQVGFVHNDLHLGNIWIDELDSDNVFVYKATNDMVWSVETKFVTKIYDFDRAAKEKTKYSSISWMNTLIENSRCDSSGQCNGFTPFFDAFTFFYNLYHNKTISKTVPEVKKWLISIFGKEPFIQEYAWGGQPCICIDGEPYNCKKCKLGIPTNIFILDTVLGNEFKPYLLNPNLAGDALLMKEWGWELPSLQPVSTPRFEFKFD